VLDAGSGLRRLGEALAGPVDADILLSHTHFDHLMGLPFFQPLYAEDSALRLHAGHLAQDKLEQAIRLVLTPPLAPDLRAFIKAAPRISAFKCGESFDLHPGLVIETSALSHPGGATGYRINWAGRSVAYITDTEHEPGRLDPGILHLARDAAAVIYDSTFLEAEFAQRRGWGHSTWQQGVALARAAGAAKLILFHHAPERTDDALHQIAAAAHADFSGASAAFDGMTMQL